jgi:hypothetical protein
MNDSVEVFVPIITKTSDGIIKKSWGYKQTPVVPAVETIIADVQPATLTQAQLQEWGYSTLTSDPKKLFVMGSDAYLTLGNRVRVNGDKVYDVRGTNIWPVHQENYLLPVQGE